MHRILRYTILTATLFLTTGCPLAALIPLSVIAGPTLSFGFRMVGDSIESVIPSVGRFCATDEGELGIVESAGVTERVCRPIKDGPVKGLKTVRTPELEKPLMLQRKPAIISPMTVPPKEVQDE